MENNENLIRQDCPTYLPSALADIGRFMSDTMVLLVNPFALTDCDICSFSNTYAFLLNIRGVLVNFKDNISCLIEEVIDNSNPNCPPEYELAAQLKRLICLIDQLIVAYDAIGCPDNESCTRVMGGLLCALADIAGQTSSLAYKLGVLARFRCNCESIGTSLANCILCNFKDEVDRFEELVRDVKRLQIASIECILENCTPCYMAKKSFREE